ncbi:hypothetical protein ACHAWF_008290 [Thalassiosira exigua]
MTRSHHMFWSNLTALFVSTDSVGEKAGEATAMRPVVKAVGTNVSDLVEVLCGPQNAPLFLKFGSDEPPTNDITEKKEDNDEGMDEEGAEGGAESEGKEKDAAVNKIDASQEAGELAMLAVSCASNLPLQTPSYAALTLGVDVKAPKETHAGFAGRCVTLAMRCLGRDLDFALECVSSKGEGGDSARADESNLTEEERVALLKSKEDQRCFADNYGGAGNGERIDAYYRAKLTLRYFAHLANVGIVSLEEGGEHSLLGLLESISEAASAAARRASATGDDGDERSRVLTRVARSLASLVLSTIPYLLPVAGGIARPRLEEMVEAIENNVLGRAVGYVSDYDPGSGSRSVLLKGELDDPVVGAAVDEEEEDEEDDDDEEEDEGPAPCADTLQDLLRTVRGLLASSASTSSTRFALLDDSPWTALQAEIAPADGMEGMEDAEVEKVPLTYEGEPLSLDLVGGDEERCKSIPHLASGDEGGAVKISCHSLDGIVFGRLAIFDAPPNPDDDDDDDEDDDEEEAEESNPNLASYVKTFSLADRHFLSDAVRDVLLCHRPMVSDGGAERNGPKEVAEQVWAVSHLFKPASLSADVKVQDDDQKQGAAASASLGIEYGIVEAILSLIAQCTPPGALAPASSPLDSHLYLSRVLLELTKLQPSLVPRAIVLATSALFRDFIPSLTPAARENLGSWLAFHLANTGYQWPRAYWDHWAPYVNAARNSRGEFVKATLWKLADTSSEGAASVAKECLPPGNSLFPALFSKQHSKEGREVSSAETDMINRLWNTSDDPENIRQYIISDELCIPRENGDSLENTDNNMHHGSVWWRARLASRALFHPVTRDKERKVKIAERTWKERCATDGSGGEDNGESGADEEVDEAEDLVADMIDAISRFKPVLLAALARDADAYDSIASGKVDDDALLLAGEVAILREVGGIILSRDLGTSTAAVECLMRDRIVSGLAVARWALQENGDAIGSNIISQWWKYVSLACREAIQEACSRLEASRTDLGGGIGMIVDDGGQNNEDPVEAAALRLEEALKSVAPILKYVIERTCRVLSACNQDKKIPLTGADVVDGTKHLFHAVLFHFRSLVLAPLSKKEGGAILTMANVQKGFASVDIDGEKLASELRSAAGLCVGEQARRLLQSLSLSLENIL